MISYQSRYLKFNNTIKFSLVIADLYWKFSFTQNIELTLTYKFKPSEWDEENNMVDKSYQGYLRENSAIYIRHSIVNASLMDYDSVIKNMEMSLLRS